MKYLIFFSEIESELIELNTILEPTGKYLSSIELTNSTVLIQIIEGHFFIKISTWYIDEIDNIYELIRKIRLKSDLI